MRERLRVAVRGAVQGVGFRPFVYRLAHALALDGWVSNSAQGVAVEVEGEPAPLREFLRRLTDERPPRSVVQHVEASWLDPAPYAGFAIRESTAEGARTALVLPDIATCDACRAEIFDPSDRRHRYPFTNCTNCGPRFSIIDALPYDRARTSMRAFTMCPACQREYDDPANRRFHAQPNACPVCGPQLALWTTRGEAIAERDDALRRAADALRRGQILAVKGLGGFHLMVDASQGDAVERLRARKRREEKPFALMYPSVAALADDCVVSPAEARLLCSAEAPIVLLERRPGVASRLAPAVAPANPSLGAMLPYTPLHLLLLDAVGRPVVATSGNRSDEPICTDEREALDRLGGIADLFLVHNRPIVRHVDDSIARVVLGRELVLRRARGYAPLPLSLSSDLPPTVAVGAHLKNAVALAVGANVFVSQHIGDLESSQALAAFEQVLSSFERLYEASPAVVVTDLHPDYLSTQHAERMGVPVVRVQHHYAHVAACMAENDLTAPVLGVAWDGTGYGLDGTIWGGEFLRVEDRSFTRVASLRPFRLPGGDRAAREPRRSALGVLFEMRGEGSNVDSAGLRAFTPVERSFLLQALARGVNAPVTTSAGRLFDAVAALLGLCQVSTFEGQAAMAVEWAVDDAVADAYPFALTEGPGRPIGPWEAPPLVVDWAPMVQALVDEAAAGAAVGAMAARVHNAMAAMIGAVAERVGLERVALSGGCFQNRHLVERTVAALRAGGFRPYWHQRVPPNDGGIAFGQIAAYARERRASVGPGRAAADSVDPVGPRRAAADSLHREVQPCV